MSVTIASHRRKVPKIINVGCGKGVIPDALNIDDSPRVFLARHPMIIFILYKAKVISKDVVDFAHFCKEHDIIRGKATNLKANDETIDVVYASHLVEMLYADELDGFIREAHRVLKIGGVLRISIADLAIKINEYNNTKDAEAFMKSFALRHERMKPSIGKRIRYLFLGERRPKWMFDGKSIIDRVEAVAGFTGQVVKAGQSIIPMDISKSINLFERADESTYIEFTKTA